MCSVGDDYDNEGYENGPCSTTETVEEYVFPLKLTIKKIIHWFIEVNA